MMGMLANRRRATALIVVLGVLVVLSILAVSFARTTSVERDAATSKADETQARFCAASGIERAISEIRESARRPYDGPDVPWYYRGEPGRRAGHGVPLRGATAPSFLAGTVYGRAVSGILPPTYEPDGDTYVLRVLDTGSMIDLNAPSDPRRAIADEPLVRMLASLGQAINAASPPITAADAVSILNFRESLPGRRFESKIQLLGVPGQPLNAEEYDDIADFVTAKTWRDSTAVEPMDPALVPPVGDLVHGRLATGTPRRSSRAPVNVNTAPREILYAVFHGLSAVFVDGDIDRGTPGGDAWHATGVSTRTTPIGPAAATRLAQLLVDRREADPVGSWAEFRAILAGEVVAGTITALQAATILANVDPNVNTHRSNPDRALFRPVDKFDLVVSTTELSFNSAGHFEITSIGRVTHHQGQIRAESIVRTIVEVFQVNRETTQSQFRGGEEATVAVEIPGEFALEHGFLAQGDLEMVGTADLLGSGLHTNGDLTLRGTPTIEGDATAAGGYTEIGNPNITGVHGGDYDPEAIPNLFPADFLSDADWILKADGTIVDRGGSPVSAPSRLSFTGSGWKTTDVSQLAGRTLYVEGDFEIAGGGPAGRHVAELSVIATGHIKQQGGHRLTPHHPLFLFLAGTDISIHGNGGGGNLVGVLYAGEQVAFGGTSDVFGPVVARGRSNSDGLVSDNKLHGTTKIHYGGGATLPGATEILTVQTVTNYPSTPAVGSVGGQSVSMADYNDVDGYIGLGTMSTPRTVLGPEPYRDRLLASWRGDRGLDADHGGGALEMVLDGAGCVVAPINGPSLCGHLLRDGVYSEIDAVPAFETLDNVGARRGTIAFWFKPSWNADPGAVAPSTRSHHLLSMSRTDGGGGTQSFQLAHVGDWTVDWSGVTGFHFERTAVENASAQRLMWGAWHPPAHRWTHFAIAWDFEEHVDRKAISVFVDGVEIPGAIRDFENGYVLTPSELAAAAINQGNLLRLGERVGNDYQLPAVAAEGTFDELISLPTPQDAVWARARHRYGRYYGGPGAIYTSAALPVVGGSELLHAVWTVRYPPGFTGRAVELELLEDGALIDRTTDLDGMALDHRVGGLVTYRLVFSPGGGGGGNPPGLLETPFIDDLTVVYSRTARIILWEEQLGSS